MEFFAGANTRAGFISLFDDAFIGIQHLYILKGSSGCGKSTLMRRIAGKAQKLGLETDLIYCSADISSLDGVIIPQLSVAIADGTAPHILDVKYPCVRESIINLGQFWDEKKLLPHTEEIIRLTDKKSAHYKNAYLCLSALGETKDITKRLISQCIDREKLDDAAFKILEKLDQSQGKSKKIFASAFTAAGIKTLSAFGKADKTYRISGKGGEHLISAIEKIVAEKGLKTVISYSCTDAVIPDAIYFPDCKAVITTLSGQISQGGEEKTVSTAKFIDSVSLSSVRAKLKGLEKLSEEIEAEARTELAAAREIHGKIEKIYIPAMNFPEMDDYTATLMKNIFGE